MLHLPKCIFKARSTTLFCFLLQRNVTSDKYKSHQHNKQKALTLMANVRHSWLIPDKLFGELQNKEHHHSPQIFLP